MVVKLLTAIALAAIFAPAPAKAACGDILPVSNAGAAPQRAIVASDLIELWDIGLPDPSYYFLPSPLALSPDGKWMAVVIDRADLSTNAHCRALVIAGTSRGAPRRVVDRGGDLIMATDVQRGLFVVTGFPDLVIPSWSPDGQWIGYLKRIDGVTQLWRARADGGGAAAVTRSQTDIERWAWSRDGRRMVFTTRPGISAANAALDKEAREGFLYDDRVTPNAGPRPQLRESAVPQRSYRIDLDGSAPAPATIDDLTLLPPDDYRGAAGDLRSIAADGRQAWTERDNPTPFSSARIWVTDAAGKKMPCQAKVCDDGIVNLWWADDGSLVFLRREGWAKGSMAIYRWRPGNRDADQIMQSDNWLIGCLYRAELLFCSAEQATRPRRVVAIDLLSRTTRVLFDPNPGFARLTIGKVKRLTWRNDIGLPAWGDLVLPPGYRRGQKLPLVVVQYHSDGFLRGGTGDDYPIFVLAAHGFAVLSIERPPFYGSNRPDLTTVEAVIAAMTENWAERRSLFSSVLTGIDQTVATGIVDRTRIGITGLSDGASTVEFALVNSKRFAAAAISTCCEDQRTVMTYGGIAWADWNRRVRNYPLATTDGRTFWQPISIAQNAGRIDTPILMQLADSEYLLALETFTALRDQGKPVEMFVYPDEYHAKAVPSHRLADYQRSIEWFEFWLQGREDADPAKRAQYLRWSAMRNAGGRTSSAPGTP